MPIKFATFPYRVKVDMNIICYSGEHFKWCFLVGFPIIIVWVICAPLTALILLYKNYKQSSSNKINQYFLMLYQGFKQNRFYWEFVNTLRKVLILMAFGFLSTFSDTYKIIVSVIVLVFTLRVQVSLEPYKEEYNNDVEILGITAGVITISSGLIYNQEYPYGFLNFLFLILIIAANTWFIAKWLLLLCICLGEKYKIFIKAAFIIATFTLRKKYLIELLSKHSQPIQNIKTTEEISDSSIAEPAKKFRKRFKIKRTVIKKRKRNQVHKHLEEENKHPINIIEKFSNIEQSEDNISKLIHNLSIRNEELSSKAKSYLIDDNDLLDSNMEELKQNIIKDIDNSKQDRYEYKYRYGVSNNDEFSDKRSIINREIENLTPFSSIRLLKE